MNNETEEDINSGILSEIKEAFKNEGFEFHFEIINHHGEYEGCTFPSFMSGTFIRIVNYCGDCMIELRQIDFGDQMVPHNQHAYRAIHQQIMMALIYSRRSQNGKYFLRHNLMQIKQSGINEFVKSLAKLHLEYEDIWLLLEQHEMANHIAELNKRQAEEQAEIKKFIDSAIGRYQGETPKKALG